MNVKKIEKLTDPVPDYRNIIEYNKKTDAYLKNFINSLKNDMRTVQNQLIQKCMKYNMEIIKIEVILSLFDSRYVFMDPDIDRDIRMLRSYEIMLGEARKQLESF